MNNACVVFLIEEAPSMQMRIVDGTHSKIESISTAVNSAIRQMEGRPPVDVAVIGYHRGVSGTPELGSRFGGVFAGKTWVSSEELVRNPIRVEMRTKQMVNPVTHAITPMTVEFPIWFEPVLGPGKLERSAAFEFLKNILEEWNAGAVPAAPPMVFSFLADLQPNESIANAVIPLSQISSSCGFPVLFQFHPGTHANVPAIKYPTAAQFLPYGPVQEMFFACSPLNEQMMISLRQNQEFPAPGAKALVYNGRMIDIVRMMSFIKMYQAALPAHSPAAVHLQQPLPAGNNTSAQPVPPLQTPQTQQAPQVPQTPPPFTSASSPSPSLSPSPLQTPFMSEPPAAGPSTAVNSAFSTTSAPGNVEIPNMAFPGSVKPAFKPISVRNPSQAPVESSVFSPESANVRNGGEFIEPCPPIQPVLRRGAGNGENDEAFGKNRMQMPDLLSKTSASNSIFNDFDKEDDEDDSLADIPTVENLPDVKAEIIPAGFHFCCEALPGNKPISEPENLSPRQTLLILLLDRSVSDLTYKPAIETWNRRLEKTRFMLGEIARRGRGRYDVSLVFYGKEADGSTSVVSDTLGKPFVADSCLSESAGQVTPMMIQIPNGIGGLISLPRKKLSFTNCSPTYPADPTVGFRRIVEIVREWDAARTQKLLPPIVLHITSGDFLFSKFDEALTQLSDGTLPPIQLQHWVFTERPHVGVCCPSEENFTQDETLQSLWERTDPLPAREFLAGVRPGIHEESRGMMVNMDFDLLFEVIDTLAKKCEKPES